ncbi:MULTISPECIES: hypothetical protein [Clostridium]|jgi:hypothetical protein|uniref:Uncharacterized protein n=1 Tax=Clostridium disporicum TaxID=84024 RepID=A0A173ZGX7_9CLOT|nr:MULTISPECIES: hypothetical protein [Clostridium]MBX9185234.1 hypothetical protein [Clostridium sp. K04]MDU7453538.1 hypothetical protein [Clostridium saudiense]CUN75023.1 Uncharacterised protein [Clostridium disporicum]CUO13038.1 Uncharacterised protein [Clostridium disporicum]SCJ66356.1 Uncharacterised protein [uncultured Clostridium sp.]
MKIKIISLEDEKSISFKNSSLGFEIVDNNSKYYKVEQDIVEISYLLEKDVNIENYNLKNNSDIILIVAKSFEGKNIEIIKKIKSKYNIIVAIGDVNLSDKYTRDEFNKLNNVLIVAELKKENKIDLKLLSLILKNKEIFNKSSIEKQRSTILIDSNESIGKVVLSLLEQFNYIQNNKEYNLYLYSKDEIGLQELAYLEDPIREYIYDEATLKIDTFTNEDITDKNYFVVFEAK